MRRLTVLYDARCALCRRARAWLEREDKFVPLEFVAAGSAAAIERFPQLTRESMLERLTVVADERYVYRGHNAWILCLWALEGYREWALRLSGPTTRRFAKRAVDLLSQHRYRLSELLFPKASRAARAIRG